jgi:hypothetical protein
MNRRKFLGWLAVAPIVGVCAGKDEKKDISTVWSDKLSPTLYTSDLSLPVDLTPEEIGTADLTKYIEEGQFTWDEFVEIADLCDAIDEYDVPMDNLYVVNKSQAYLRSIEFWHNPFSLKELELKECQKEKIVKCVAFIDGRKDLIERGFNSNHLTLAAAYKAARVLGKKTRYFYVFKGHGTFYYEVEHSITR